MIVVANIHVTFAHIMSYLLIHHTILLHQINIYIIGKYITTYIIGI